MSQRSPAKMSKKRASKPKKVGPRVSELILRTVAASKERSGVSAAALRKALAAGGYDVDKNKARITTAIKSLVARGALVQTKGTGASGFLKISTKAAEGKDMKPAKKAPRKAKKPAASKKPAVATRKSPRLAKKSAAAKKPAEAAKKPAAAAKKSAKSRRKAPARRRRKAPARSRRKASARRRRKAPKKAPAARKAPARRAAKRKVKKAPAAKKK